MALLYGLSPKILFAPANQRPSPVVDHDWRPFSLNNTCRAAVYRQKLMLYPAGLFNTGTHFAFEMFRLRNCVDRGGKKGKVARSLPHE